MICHSVHIRKQKLDDLFAKVSALNHDAEMQAHWTRYLCVMVAAFLENAVKEIYGDYADRTASKTSRYVRAQLQGFQNAKMQKIYDTTGAFNDDWRRQLQLDTEGELRDSVDSIIANRHNIAHGRDVGISFVNLKKYYEDALKVVEMLDDYCHR